MAGEFERTPTISIAGKVGAGASVPVFDAYAKGDGPQVICPPGLSPSGVVAVEVEGDSMEPVYSAGDLLFYSVLTFCSALIDRRWSRARVSSRVPCQCALASKICTGSAATPRY